MNQPEPFRRYWCMTPDGIGVCIEHSTWRGDTDARVQMSGYVEWYPLGNTRPATFLEYLFRPDQFGNGIPYPLAAVWALLFTGATVFAVFCGAEFPELGWRIFTAAFGPVVMAVIVLTMYRQFKRGR